MIESAIQCALYGELCHISKWTHICAPHRQNRMAQYPHFWLDGLRKELRARRWARRSNRGEFGEAVIEVQLWPCMSWQWKNKGTVYMRVAYGLRLPRKACSNSWQLFSIAGKATDGARLDCRHSQNAAKKKIKNGYQKDHMLITVEPSLSPNVRTQNDESEDTIHWNNLFSLQFTTNRQGTQECTVLAATKAVRWAVHFLRRHASSNAVLRVECAAWHVHKTWPALPEVTRRWSWRSASIDICLV